MSSFDQIIQQRGLDDKTGRALEECSICGGHLHPDDFYTIAKVYNGGKPMLSAVQCFNCQMTTKDYASEQSIENIMLYSGRRFNEFLQDPIQRKIYHLDDPKCLITGEELQADDNFELYSFNVPGSGLEENNFVFIGPSAMEQMSELLSKETRDSWGRFTDSLTPETPDIVVSPMFIG